MSTKWFKTFINDSSYQYEECQPKGIVIDGLSFIYTFSKKEKISWKEGGRYWLLREKLIEFFDCLKSSHIEPIIVTNGLDLRSVECSTTIAKSRIRRRKQKNQVIAEWAIHNKMPPNNIDHTPLPVVSIKVFLMAMKELGVPVLFADGEADRATVAIANYYNYPVLANDSDYYMYDIKAGYIPIDRFNWHARLFKVEVYKLCKFNSQFGLKDPQLSRVIPAVLKLELLNRLTEEGVISNDPNRQQVRSLVHFFSKVSNVQQFISHIREKMDKGEEIAEALRAQIKQAEEMYDDIKPLSKDDLQAKFLGDSATSVVNFPKWLMNLMNDHNDEGRFLVSAALKGECLPRCVIDDPHKPTARLASRDIRQSMYTMMSPLMKEKRVKEIMRNQLRKGGNIEDIEMVDHEVPILFPSSTLPSVLDIEGMSNDEKLSVFCRVLGIDRNILDGFDKEWKLVIAAACYWVKECKPKKKLIEALAATFVQCSRIRPDAETRMTNQRVLYNLSDIPHAASMNALHNFTCFQYIYIDTATLNDLLQGCLDDTLSPAFFFDGKFALTYVCTDKLVATFDEKIVPDTLYRKIFETLMGLL